MPVDQWCCSGSPARVGGRRPSEETRVERETPPAGAAWSYHVAAAVAGVLQVVVQQLGGAVLEGLRQSTQQHGELGRVELKQGDQDHLGRLEETWRGGPVRMENISGGGRGDGCPHFSSVRTQKRRISHTSGRPSPRRLSQKVFRSSGGFTMQEATEGAFSGTTLDFTATSCRWRRLTSGQLFPILLILNVPEWTRGCCSLRPLGGFNTNGPMR